MSDQIENQENQEETQSATSEETNTDNATGQANDSQQTGGETFTQAQVDAIVKERLERERAKSEKEAQKAKESADRKAAEEQGKYKELYEDLQAKLTAAEQKTADLERARLRDKVARKHKLPDALAQRLQGETEDELEADAKTLLEAMPRPAPDTATDGVNGVNNTAPGQTMTDVEIQEMAAVYGVSPDGLRKSLGIRS